MRNVILFCLMCYAFILSTLMVDTAFSGKIAIMACVALFSGLSFSYLTHRYRNTMNFDDLSLKTKLIFCVLALVLFTIAVGIIFMSLLKFGSILIGICIGYLCLVIPTKLHVKVAIK